MTVSDRTSFTPTNGIDVGLEKVTRRSLHEWGIFEYKVYRAKPGSPFEEVNLTEDVDLPLHQGEQTLIFCETPGEHCDLHIPQDFEEPQEPLNASADVRWYFRKNKECDPLHFEGHKHNPWRHDDIIFQLPYFQFNADLADGVDIHTSDDFEVDKKWYFNYGQTGASDATSPGNPSSFIGTIRQSISPKRSEEKGDEERGQSQKQTRSASTSLCFESKALTICMLPFLDGKKADEVEGPEQKGRINCKSWVALVIAPEDIIWKGSNEEGKLLNDRLLDGNLANRPPANRKRHNRHRFGKEKFKSPRDADYFQTCLIEVGMRTITDTWNDNVNRATKACHAFEKMIHNRIHRSPNSRSEYWRRDVNDDLLRIYKLQKRLESLEANLFNNITNPELGIWSKFRKARPRQRLEQLEREEEQKKRKQKGKAQKSSETENERDDRDNRDALERERLRFLLYGCMDRHWDRLCGQSKKLRQSIDELQALRQLLVELSQTRASLYANDLGDNVMYLTYISILFLPLSFCTSLWAMNHELPFYAFVPTICVTSAVTAAVLTFIRIRMSYH